MRRKGCVPAALACFAALIAGAATGAEARLQAEADALLTQAVLTRSVTDVCRLAVLYRDHRCVPLVRILLDPWQGEPLEPELVDQLAGAAEVLEDTGAVTFLWRHITGQGRTATRRVEQAVLALARPEHVALIAYSLDEDDLAVARVADRVLRRVGAREAVDGLRNAITVRNAWLDGQRHKMDVEYEEVIEVRSLVRQHRETAGLLGEPSVVPWLRSVLAGTAEGTDALAARALYRQGDEAWRPWAGMQLHAAPIDRPPTLERITAAELLARDGDPVGRDSLMAWLHTGPDDVVVEALCSAVRLATDTLLPGLRAWRAANPGSPHRALSALALCACGDLTARAEVWEARALLRRYDFAREPPIHPIRTFFRAIGRRPSGPWPPPVWQEDAVREELGIPAPGDAVAARAG